MADGISYWMSNFKSLGGDQGQPFFRCTGPSSGNFDFQYTNGSSTAFKIPLTGSPPIDQPHDNFDESNSRFVVPFSGYYFFIWNVCFQLKNGNQSDDLGLSLRVNNGVVVNYEDGGWSHRGSGTAFRNLTGSALQQCATNDQVELWATPYTGYATSYAADQYSIGSGVRTNLQGWLIGGSG